jgi:putative membrane protein
MTAAMVAMHRKLPPGEQYPLQPREVTVRVAEKAGVAHELKTEGEVKGATLAAHFVYGAATGALYGGIAPFLPGKPAVRGILFGLAMWSGSYLGWLPALGIRRPATEQPADREGLMIAAHVVWGTALGLLAAKLGVRQR